MKRNPADIDLLEPFEILKSEEACSAPDFERTSARRRTYRPAPLAYASGIAVVAAAISLFALSSPHADDPANPFATEEIPFDLLADTVTRERYAAEVTAWKSPTDFLLDPGNPFPNHPKP